MKTLLKLRLIVRFSGNNFVIDEQKPENFPSLHQKNKLTIFFEEKFKWKK
jgi:hypothetical protein